MERLYTVPQIKTKTGPMEVIGVWYGRSCMGYCRSCGEEVGTSDRYCWNCGDRLTEHGPDEEVLEKFWGIIDGLVDSEVEHLAKSDLEVVPPLVDRYLFAYKLYIFGVVKGTVSTIIFIVAEDWDDVEQTDLDLSPVYERIFDRISEREDDIRVAIEEE